MIMTAPNAGEIRRRKIHGNHKTIDFEGTDTFFMARKPNYNFERMERERAKAAKKAARLEAKRKGGEKNTSNVELESNEPVLLLAVHPGIVPNMRRIKMRYPKPRAEKHFRTLRKTDKQVSLMGKMVPANTDESYAT